MIFMTYFVYLQNRFLLFLSFLFSSKNPFKFLGDSGGGGGGKEGAGSLFYIFDVPPRDGLNDFRWNPTVGRGVLKRTCKMHGPFAYW